MDEAAYDALKERLWSFMVPPAPHPPPLLPPTPSPAVLRLVGASTVILLLTCPGPLSGLQEEDIYPNEQLFLQQQREIGERTNEWTHPPILVALKEKAKELGLWNLWMPVDSAEVAGRAGGGLSNEQ